MHFETYQDAAGEWRWRAVARNGKIVADGSEGYASQRNARRAVNRFLKRFANGLGQDNSQVFAL